MDQVVAVSSVSKDKGHCAFTLTYTSGETERVLMNLAVAEQLIDQLSQQTKDVRSAYSECLPFGLKHMKPDADSCNKLLMAYGLLYRGAWAKGWKLHTLRWLHESEGKRRCLQDPCSCQAAIWQGEPLRGKRIVLFCEQGYGDGVQFLRFTSQLAEMGAYVLGYAPPTMAALWMTVPGMKETVIRFTTKVEADFRASVMDLPSLLGITPDNLPSAL